MARIRESLVLASIHEGMQPHIAALASLAEENARYARALADELAHLAATAGSSGGEGSTNHIPNKPSRDPVAPPPPVGCPMWESSVDPPGQVGAHRQGDPPGQVGTHGQGDPPGQVGAHGHGDPAAGYGCALM